MDFPSPAGVVDTLSGSAQLTGRVHASAPLAAFPAHPPDAGHRPLRPLFILRAVRRRWRLLVAVGAAGSLAALVLVESALPPAQSHTTMYVRLTPTESIPGGPSGPPDARDPRVQVELVKSQVVIRGALGRSPAADLPSVRENPGRAAAGLAAGLKVDVVAPQLLRLTLPSPDPREAAVFVRAVGDSYLREVAAVDDGRRKKRIDFLLTAAEQCRDQLSDRRRELAAAEPQDRRVASAAGLVGATASGDAASKRAAVAQLEKIGGLIAAELEAHRLGAAVERLAAPNTEPPDAITTASPGRAVRLALALVSPFVLAFALVVGREYIFRRVYAPEDLPRTLHVRVLGIVPGTRSGGADRLARPPAVDRLAAVLRHALAVSGGRVLAVTSAEAGGGKSTLARQLAAGLSATGTKTLLIDGDLACPAVGRAFGLSGRAGLCDVVRGETGVSDGFPVAPDLFVLPAGNACPRAAQELTRGALRAVLAQCRPVYDHIVIDAGPVLASPLGLAMCQAADGVVVSVLCGTDREGPLGEALGALAAVDAPASGVVLCGSDAAPWS